MKVSLKVIPGFPSATKSILPEPEAKALSETIIRAKLNITRARYRKFNWLV